MPRLCLSCASVGPQLCLKVGPIDLARLLSIDSDAHQQNEECRHVPTKQPRVNKVNEHVLLLIGFCR